MNGDRESKWMMGCTILFFLVLLATVFGGCLYYNHLVNPLNISVPRR